MGDFNTKSFTALVHGEDIKLVAHFQGQFPLK